METTRRRALVGMGIDLPMPSPATTRRYVNGTPFGSSSSEPSHAPASPETG